MESIIDFEFEMMVGDKLATVEVSATIEEACPGDRYSDWDAKGLQRIDGYTVFDGNEKLYVDIPEKELYVQLSKHLRDRDLDEGFENGGGEF